MSGAAQVESWAFALDEEGLALLTRARVFDLRKCKLCRDGVVVLGEYGISSTVLRAGYNIATLMSMYAAVRCQKTRGPTLAERWLQCREVEWRLNALACLRPRVRRAACAACPPGARLHGAAATGTTRFRQIMVAWGPSARLL